jgi:hypothetical protein
LEKGSEFRYAGRKTNRAKNAVIELNRSIALIARENFVVDQRMFWVPQQKPQIVAVKGADQFNRFSARQDAIGDKDRLVRFGGCVFRFHVPQLCCGPRIAGEARP